MPENVPVIAVDGPSGAGKGTICRLLAHETNWHLLDSGALYRLLAFAADKENISVLAPKALAARAMAMHVVFKNTSSKSGLILLDGEDVTTAIRTESCGNHASKIAAIPEVREALLVWQRNFRQQPGLIADGRDMGTVVFPDAKLKLFLDASAEERANRRFEQLKEQGLDANLESLYEEIAERDLRDRTRKISPLKPAEDAIVIDTTILSVDKVIGRVFEEVRKIFPNALRH